MAVQIVEVVTRAQLKKFVEFGNDLYRNSAYHVPVLIKDEMDTLDRAVNPAFEFCDAVYYLAYKNNDIVGRIAGIINYKANETWNQQAARFGFVDFINDNEVVDALFSAVEHWAKDRGMDSLQGPLGFTDMDKEGMLVEGFDQLGTMITIYNYAYYPKQLERIGFVKDIDWKEFQIMVPNEVPERHLRIGELVCNKYGLKVLSFDSVKQILPYGPNIFKMINKCYAHLYGFSELSDKQIQYYTKLYVPLLRPEFVVLIQREHDDEIVGFGIALPNLSRALQKANGHLFPFGFIHLMASLKGKPKVVDLYLMGVLPEYQNKGVNTLFFNHLIPIFNKMGIQYAESNPELETNTAVQMQWDYFERRNHKRRRAYIKRL